MDKILAGVDLTKAYIDDVISGSATVDEHLPILRTVFECFCQAGVRTEKSKCRFLQTSVNYLGHRIDAAGLHPTDERLRALRDIGRPENKKMLRSFLGAVNYYSKFIPYLQHHCAPLHQLTRQDSKWHWNDQHDAIFEHLKSVLTSDATLVHYDEAKPLIVATDASDVGLGAVLLHRFPDGSERPIAYASRLLSDTEKRYSTVDKEALAVVYAIDTKFQQYLLGRHFLIKTDHKPLERLFGPRVETPKLAASRLARWAMTMSTLAASRLPGDRRAMTMSNYNYDIQYQTGSSNAPADVLSRFPVDPPTAEGVERLGARSNILHLKLQDVTISKKALQQETMRDETLFQVIAHMEQGWPDNTSSLPPELHHFFEKRMELSYEEKILLWKGRIVFPANLRQQTLQTLHDGHPGVCAMKDLARYYAWWPHIDDEIEHLVTTCSSCQENRPRAPEVPLFSWNVPSEAWARIHVDFAGPFEGHMWLVVIDAYTKWIEVCKMKSTSTTATVRKLREIFARFGLPRTIVSDNGPQFTSDEFQTFCKSNCLHHVTGAPYHPKTNGLAERAVRTFKERMKASQEVPDVDLRLQKFLISYRNTPQKSTGRAPSESMFGRRLRTCLDLIKPDMRAKMDQANFKQQLYHDRSAKNRSFTEGDKVWVLNPSGSGYQAGVVVRRSAPLSYLVELNGKQVRKHADQLRSRQAEVDVTGDSEHSDIDGPEAEMPQQQQRQPPIEPEVPPPPQQLPPIEPEMPPPPPFRPLLQATLPPSKLPQPSPPTVSRRAVIPSEGSAPRRAPPQKPEASEARSDTQQTAAGLRRSGRERHCPKVMYNPT